MFLHGAGQPRVQARIGQGYVLTILSGQANTFSGIIVSWQYHRGSELTDRFLFRILSELWGLLHTCDRITKLERGGYG
jgi:hypothetical protein